MSRFLFIRHAAIDGLGRKIAGRMPGVSLNAVGRRQVERLASRLVHRGVHDIYTSPQMRAQETARAIADHLGLVPKIAPELDEIDFGEWTGKSYDELERLPEWRSFNALRSAKRIPDGELLLEAQARVIGLMARLHQDGPQRNVALVSHGDVIRGALAHYLGAPLDFLLRFEISPASVSAVELCADEPRILWINKTAD